MQFNSLVVSTVIVAGLSSGLATAQDTQLSEEQAKRVEQLTSEIENLTEELNALKEQTQQTEDVKQEAEEVATAAREVAATAADVESDVKLWSGDIDLGYVQTRGNTEETNLKSAANITRERDAWRFITTFDSLNSKSDGERTAEKYFYSNRLAYAYTEHNYIFGYASYEDDRFSGFEYQVTAAAGYGRRIINESHMQWDAEVGPGYRYSKYDEGLTPDATEETILRLFTHYSWDFSDTANFSQTVSVEAGDDSTISKSVTAIKTQLIGAFALKLSYTIKYNDAVPSGTKHADEETALTLTYSF